MRKGNIKIVNVMKGSTQLQKVMYGNKVVWENYSTPHTFEYSDQLSNSGLSIGKTYTLPDGLVTEVNAYFRCVHSNNNDCKMSLSLYGENGDEIVKIVASYYLISEKNNANGTFTTAQGDDGNYGSYIKYKFNKPTKLSKIYVSNYSDVGQWQKYGVRGNVQMLIK